MLCRDVTRLVLVAGLVGHGCDLRDLLADFDGLGVELERLDGVDALGAFLAALGALVVLDVAAVVDIEDEVLGFGFDGDGVLGNRLGYVSR